MPGVRPAEARGSCWEGKEGNGRKEQHYGALRTAHTDPCTVPCIRPQHQDWSGWRQSVYGTVFLMHPQRATINNRAVECHVDKNSIQWVQKWLRFPRSRHSSSTYRYIEPSHINSCPTTWESSILLAWQEPRASASQSYLFVIFWSPRRENSSGLCRPLRIFAPHNAPCGLRQDTLVPLTFRPSRQSGRDNTHQTYAKELLLARPATAQPRAGLHRTRQHPRTQKAHTLSS